MANVTKDEGIQLLGELKKKLAELKETGKVSDALQILALAGQSVGYKPAFRALVMDVEPEKAIKWG